MVGQRYKTMVGSGNKKLGTNRIGFGILADMPLSRQKDFLGLAAFGIGTKALALALGAYFISRSSAWINHTFVDLWGWLDFMNRSAAGGIPYVEFSKEYPVAAGMVYWVFAKLNPEGDSTRFLQLHTLVMSIWDVANTLLFYSILIEIRARRAFFGALLFLVLPTFLILSPVRFEAVVLTPVLLGYRQHRRGNLHQATFWWAIGAMIKIFPLLFIAVQEFGIWSKYKGKWKKLPGHAVISAGIVLLVALLVNGPFLIAGLFKNGNIDAWLATYRFHLERPLYWDTVLGVLHLWWGNFPWERHASAWSSILMIGLLLLTPRLRIEAKSVLLMGAALLFNRVYSTQFHLWFYPMLIVLLATEAEGGHYRKLLFGLLLLDLVNVLVYPFAFSNALQEIHQFEAFSARDRGGGWSVLFSGLIFFRAVVLLWFMGLLWKEKSPIELNR
ncbi:MAG: hypothetical protein KGP28_08130 [Bdellovibrionales bacterium]|nr:hypothetical protein [Bdellovibrionales bacterium]